MSRAHEIPPREAEDDPLPAPRQRAERKRPVRPAVREIGGPKGPEPTRFGDWEKGGRCIDF